MTEPVVVLVDDTAAGAAVIDAGCALAQLTRRTLQLVFVEDEATLAAAALPPTRVLTPSGPAWSPLAPADVERAWQAQVQRLRSLAGHASSGRSVAWSLQVLRGRPDDAAVSLLAQPSTNLLLLVSAARRRWHATATRPRRTIVVLDEDGGGAVDVALRLAEALGAHLLRQRGDGAPAPAGADAVDLVVLPLGAGTPRRLAALGTPVLVVGTDAGASLRPLGAASRRTLVPGDQAPTR